jgi:hypothetical protein
VYESQGIRQDALDDAARVLSTIGVVLAPAPPGRASDVRIAIEGDDRTHCEAAPRVAYAYYTRGEIYVCPDYIGTKFENGPTLAHELGHILGLGHLPDGQVGIFAAYQDGETFTDLTTDDVILWLTCRTCGHVGQ